MAKPAVMVNGLPGKMATIVAEHVLDSGDFTLASYAFTGPEITDKSCHILGQGEGVQVELIKPNERTDYISAWRPDFMVDFTHPSAVNSNAELYCRANIPFPFVMGTTGGDRKALEDLVRSSNISAVIAPNMAKQIVALQAVMENFANEHPNSLRGYELTIEESHQKGKEDTSGTAKAMVKYLQNLGILFDVKQIKRIREPREQELIGVPYNHLKGHGWHTYQITGDLNNLNLKRLRDTLVDFFNGDVFRLYTGEPGRGFSWGSAEHVFVYRRSLDENVEFCLKADPGTLKLTHNVNGRSIYAEGVLDALRFLNARKNEKGQVYSMIDVLKAS